MERAAKDKLVIKPVEEIPTLELIVELGRRMDGFICAGYHQKDWYRPGDWQITYEISGKEDCCNDLINFLEDRMIEEFPE